jgi:hypothetical protein
VAEAVPDDGRGHHNDAYQGEGRVGGAGRDAAEDGGGLPGSTNPMNRASSAKTSRPTMR